MTTLSKDEAYGTTAGTAAVLASTPDPRRWRALAVIAIAQLMVVLDATIVNVALPQVQTNLHISTADRQWIITAYGLAFGGLLLLGGRVADYVGRKRIFLIGLVGFASASALGGFAQNEAMLFGSRALQGAFAALLAPAALSLITVTFTETHERAKAFAVYGAIAGGGAAIGLLLGGVLTEYGFFGITSHDSNWRFCLFVNIPIAIVAFVMAVPTVQESKAEGDTKYDIPGAVLVSVGLASLVFGFTRAATQGVGWAGTSTIALLALAVVCLAAFVVVEMRTAVPLLPLRVVLDRNRGGSFLTSLIVGSGLFAMFLFLTLYLQLVLNYSPVKTGLAFLPFSLGIIFSAGMASQLLPRLGPKPLMMGGLALGTVGILLLTGIDPSGSFLSHVLPAEIMISVGMGFNFVALSSTALIGVAPHDAGVASALVNATQQIGGAVGTALLNTVAASAITAYVKSHPGSLVNGFPNAAASVHSYHVAFAWGGAFLFTGFVITTLLIRAGKDELPAEGTVVHAG